jgi:dipeptidyl aminopeptidase/acylaminoacyl peptidase
MNPGELTIETITTMWRPTEVRLAPDGSWVAWSAAPYTTEGEHPEGAIWVAPFDGSQPAQRWTFGGEDRSPRWSPDGRRLAFLSDRAKRGTAGVYVMPTGGGEAMPLAVRERAVTAIAWSPDSARLAFLAPEEPDDDDQRREREHDDADVFGQRWKANRLWIVELESKQVARVQHGDGHPVAVDWSPDGGTIALVVQPTPEADGIMEARVRLVRPDRSGAESEPRDVYAAPGAEDLCFTAGGDIAFAAYHEANPVSALTVWSAPANGRAEASIVGPLAGENACGLEVRPDREGGLMVLIADGLDTRFERVEPDTGRRTIAWTASGDVACFDCGPGDQMAVGCHYESGPLEVWAGMPDEPRRLSDHHRALEGVALGEVEDFYFEAPDGLALDGILVRPAGTSASGPWPTIVVPHGGPYGRSGRQLHVRPGAWAQWLAAGGYAVLMPNYRGGSGRGQAFAALARADMGGAEWLDVLAAVDAAVERGIADPDRLGIGGWSQGGFLSAWAVTQTDRFKAAVVGAGPTDWAMLSATSDLPSFESALAGGAAWDATARRLANERSPLVHAGSVTTPVLILQGQQDERIPVHQAVALHRALRGTGVPVELVTYPREPHAVHERQHQADILRRVRAWYDRWLVAADSR